MRKLALIFLAAAFLLPSVSSAASWRTFSSTKAGFAVSYPSKGWRMVTFAKKGAGMTSAVLAGPHQRALTVAFLPVKPASTLAGTWQRYRNYMQRILKKGATMKDYRWTTTTLGGQAAMLAIASPAKGSRLHLSTAIYLAQWRGKAYEVLLSGTHKPPYTRLSQFPAIYQQILRTWRFI